MKLSTKMLVAALPLILAVSALLALTVRDDLQAIDRAENGAELGRMWDPLIDALTAIEAEAAQTGGPDATLRRATDDSINVLRNAATELNAATAAGDHITASRSSLSAARRNQDMSVIAPDLQVEIDPVQAYAQASREIVAVGQLLPSEAGDPALGRELLAVVKLAEAKLAANGIIANVDAWQAEPTNVAALRFARDQFGTLETVLGEFEAIAPEEWAAQFRQAGFAPAVARARGQLDTALRTAQSGGTIALDISEFETLVDNGVQFQVQVSNEIVQRASEAVDAQRESTLRRLGIALGVTVAAVALAWLIARSITKRIRAVSAGAQRVTNEQLPALVEALRDPRGQGALPAIEPVSSRGADELAELADSFNTMQGTLVDVAHQQVEVLRRGVSDIFVTMARRNRSLIDRQLAMLDEFEAEVDDPEVLANYYQLDHMATRMRRNSESLLVLASAEPKRRRVKATEVDDVVRAAIGEVEDYRRIEIEALESLQVRGNVVADVSHLLAELLDNATSFSPPDSVVRVGGRMGDKGYMIRILDAGVGIGRTRLTELNALLREPPVVGLSVESTLGMSVVSLLANKHGISVTLAPGNPGLIVDVVLPPALFGPIDAHAPVAAAPAIGTPTDQPADDASSIVAWDDAPQSPDVAPIDVAAAAERFEQVDPYEPIETERPVSSPADDDRPVTTSDWRKMSLSLSAFQTGMQSAQGGTTEDDPYALPVDDSEHFEPAVEPVASTDADPSPLEIALDAAEAVSDVDGDAEAVTAVSEVEADAAEAVSEVEGDGEAATDDHPTPEPTTAHADPEVDAVSEVEGDGEAVTDDHPTPEPTTAHADPVSETEAHADPVSEVEGDGEAATDDHPTPEPATAHAAPAPTEPEPELPSIADLAALVTDDEESPAEPEPSLPAAEPMLPPPAGPKSEFDHPPAPPLTVAGPSAIPVSPRDARPIPTSKVPEPSAPSLPTRTPGAGPDGGPDRLAAEGAAATNGTHATNGDRPPGLPSRGPAEPFAERDDSPTVGAADPDALRDRLRAFQAEFRSALGTESVTDTTTGTDTATEHRPASDHDDLGDDR